MIGIENPIDGYRLHCPDNCPKSIDPTEAIVIIVACGVVSDTAHLVAGVTQYPADILGCKVRVDTKNEGADPSCEWGRIARSCGCSRPTPRGRADHAHTGREKIQLPPTCRIVLAIVAARPADSNYVGVRDHLIKPNVNVIAVATGPEDRRPAPSTTLACGEQDCVLKNRCESPIRSIRSEAAGDHVRARRHTCPCNLQAGISRISDRTRQSRLRSDLIAPRRQKHQCALRCRSATVNTVVVTRRNHTGAERAVIAVWIVRQRLAERAGCVEEAGLCDDRCGQIQVLDIEAVINDGNAHPAAQGKVPRALGRDVGSGDPSTAPSVV